MGNGRLGANVKKQIIGWVVFAGFLMVIGVGILKSVQEPPGEGGQELKEKSIPATKDEVISFSAGKTNAAPATVSAPSPFVDIQTVVLDERQVMMANGDVERKQLVKRDGKYPNRVVIETLHRDRQQKKFVPNSRTEMAAGHLLVNLRDGLEIKDLEELNEQYGATVLNQLPGTSTYIVQLEAPSLDAVDDAIRFYSEATEKVAYAEPDFVRYPSVIPNDTDYGQLWGMSKISAPAAWDISKGNSSVVVAVIDTGMDMDHPDLLANLWNNDNEISGDGVDNDGNGYIDDVNGWNFVADSNIPEDDHSHGTHCAGTIGAVGNNANQVVGVCWTVGIMPLKSADANGFFVSDTSLAVRYAVDNGAKVLSNSYGGLGYSQTDYDAILYAHNKGAIFIAAAGNDTSNNDVIPQYPASYDVPNIISVAATDSADDLATFSNFGATSVDLAAPGVDIMSTVPDDTIGLMSGTSMACPHVAGAVALLVSVKPDLTPAEAKQILLASVDPVAELSGKMVTGGRLNLQKLMAGATDSDGDGMPDEWESLYGFNPFDASDGGTNDFDGDFLFNTDEYLNNCNPTNSDTDADSLVDGWEVTYGFNPLNVSGQLPKLQYLGANSDCKDAYAVSVQSNLAYIADGSHGLKILNVSDPFNVELIGAFPTLGSARGVEVNGNYAYVSDAEKGFFVINVSNPTNPVLEGLVQTNSFNAVLDGSHAYVAGGTDGLFVIDISSPANPSIVGSYDSPYITVNDLAVVGSKVYMAMDGKFGRLNISNPASPSSYYAVSLADNAGSSVGEAIRYDGTQFYITLQNFGYSIFNLSMNRIARYENASEANDIDVFDGFTYLADGTDGLRIVDSTVLNDLKAYARYSSIYAKGVTYSEGYTYVAGLSSGFHVFVAGKDADADGLYDKWEMDNFQSLSETAESDFDNDGIINWGEYLASLDPTDDDQDSDTLIDGLDEVQSYNTDPRTDDTDGDTLTDHFEVTTNGTDNLYLTNPLLADTDDDGMTDYEELFVFHTDPLNGDEDGDNLPDGWEIEHGLDITVDDSDLNPDGDGLTNYQEYLFGSNPNEEDSDFDGFLDHEERDAGTNPLYDYDPLFVDDNHTNDLVPWDPDQGYAPGEEVGSRDYPFDSIQEAINAAQNNIKILVDGGWYDGHSNRNIDTGGKILTIEGVDGAASTWIFGDGQGSGFIFQSGEGSNTVIKGFSITTEDGNCDEGIGCASQHGILCKDASSPYIVDCVVVDNEMSGIQCEFGSSPVIENCEIGSSAVGINCSGGSTPFISNVLISDSRYGIVAVDSVGIQIKDSTVTNCWGRGIWTKNDANVSIERTEILDNWGGVRADNCQLIMDRCKVQRNVSPDYYTVDGAVYISTVNQSAYAENTEGVEDITDSEENGAGILLLENSILYIQNLLITENHAVALDPDYPEDKSYPDYGLGGGLYVGSGCDLTAMNCTIANNIAMRGAGISSYGSHKVSLRNEIIWDNNATNKWVVELTNGLFAVTNIAIAQYDSLHCRDHGAGYDFEYCDIEGSGYTVPRNYVISTNPLFAAVGDYHLSSNSPCIDVGTPHQAPFYDLDGIHRPLDGNNDGNPVLIWDLGAYESIHEKANSDTDGIPDIDEIRNGTDPTSGDTDGDGMDDTYETLYGLDANRDDTSEDADGDGMLNAQEFANGTAANNEDTDGDKSPDGDEDIAGTIPTDPTSYFYVSNVQPLAGGGCDISFDTVVGRIYTVYCCTELGGDWGIVLDNIVGDGNPAVVADPYNAGNCFYKVEVYK
jgi:hypothetical protein